MCWWVCRLDRWSTCVAKLPELCFFSNRSITRASSHGPGRDNLVCRSVFFFLTYFFFLAQILEIDQILVLFFHFVRFSKAHTAIPPSAVIKCDLHQSKIFVNSRLTFKSFFLTYQQGIAEAGCCLRELFFRFLSYSQVGEYEYDLSESHPVTETGISELKRQAFDSTPSSLAGYQLSRQ